MLRRSADYAVRLLGPHRVIFVSVLAALCGLNIWSGPPWWSFWPMLVVSILFTLHYMLARSIIADERWADERADHIADKSYDQAHMTSIIERCIPPPKRPQAKRTDATKRD